MLISVKLLTKYCIIIYALGYGHEKLGGVSDQSRSKVVPQPKCPFQIETGVFNSFRRRTFGPWKVRRLNRALQTHHSCCLRLSLFYAWSASKFQRTAVSTGFVQKCLWNLCTLIFAKVNGNFASDAHRYAAVKSILRANLQEHNLKRRPNDSIIEA